MRRITISCACISLWLLLAYVSSAQINSGSPAVEFGSQTSYPYGIMPTNLPTSGTYLQSQDCADLYATWKSSFVEQCTYGYRVKFDDTQYTVSEGIAYGMLLSAYAGDKTLFDGLWQYYLNNKNSNGVMDWKITGCDDVYATGGATDAELDAAMALIIASEQWPSATSPYTYKTEALYLIGKIRSLEVNPSTYQLVNGDAWGLYSTCRNPSYFAPAYFREFAKVETSYASFWNSCVTASDALLLGNRNSTTGLVSNWCSNTSPYSDNNCNGTGTGYGADASRNPWRMAVDVLWNGSSTASTSYDICGKLSTWITGYESQLKGPVSQSASNPSSGSWQNGTYSTFGLAPMAVSTKQSSLNLCYTNIKSLSNDNNYFNQTMRLLSMFVLTGNFWKPGTSGTITAPEVLTAETDAAGSTITVTFSKAMSTPATSAYGTFSLEINGTSVSSAFSTISISINGTTAIDLTLTTAPVTGDVITLSYTPGTLTSTDGGVLAAFTDLDVDNMLAGNSTVLDDCEDADEVNSLGGEWFTYNDVSNSGSSTVSPNSASSAFTMTSGGASSSSYSAMISYTLNKGSNTNSPFVGMGTATNADTSLTADWSESTGISFWYKGSASSLNIIIPTVTDYGYHYFTVPACTTWTQLSYDWGAIVQPTWAVKCTFDTSQVKKIQWQVTGSTGNTGEVWVDYIEVNGLVSTVSKTALVSAITSAQAVHDASVEGTSEGQYPSGSKATLLAAIAAATTVNENSAATQLEVNSATATLLAAIVTFQSSVISLTPVDKTSLELAISNAQSIYDASTEGTANGQFPSGSKATLLAAITAASAVNANSSATQVQVDNAVATLNGVLATFLASVISNAAAYTIIADAEDGNATKLQTYWYSYNDSTNGGGSTITPLTTATAIFTMTLGGANGTDSAAMVTYSLLKGSLGYDPYIGFGFALSDPEAAYDLSGSTGISFYHKGDAVTLQVALSTNTDADYYSASIIAHTDWTQVTLPWGSFAQNTGWGTDVSWNAANIVKFQWQKQTTTGTSGSIWIDEVQIDGLDLSLPSSIDKTALAAAIATGQSTYSSAVEGTAAGQYPTGSKSTLQTAITAANIVYNNSSATQEQVDDATAALSATIAAFLASVNTTTTVSKTALATTISAAQAAYSQATEGTAAGQYPSGSKSTLLAAIAAASTVYANSSATQTEVDNATTVLAAALSTFLNSVIGVDTDELETTIANAQAIYDVAVEGTASGQYASGSKATLLAAITSAEAVLNDASATQAEIDQATSDLAAAITAFEDGVVGVSKTYLELAINNAGDVLDAATVGTLAGEYSQDDYDTFSDAIDAALAVLNNASASQATVDAATATLNAAVTAFNAAVITTGAVELSRELLVYPNPMGDQVRITASKNISRVELLSTLGTTILSSNSDDQHIELPTSSITPGVYYLLIFFSDGTVQNLEMMK